MFAGFGGGLGGAAAPAAAAAAPPAGPQLTGREALILLCGDDGPLGDKRAALLHLLQDPLQVAAKQQAAAGGFGGFGGFGAAAAAAPAAAAPAVGAADLCGPPAAGVAERLQCLRWLLCAEAYPDQVLGERPNHRQLLAALLKGDVVMNILKYLHWRLKPMTARDAAVPEPPNDLVHAAAGLVLVTQRCQLTEKEFERAVEALDLAIQAIRQCAMATQWGTSRQHQTGSAAMQRALRSRLGPEEAPPRSPPLSAGGLLEDTAYLLALCTLNALRVPADGTLALWDRDGAGGAQATLGQNRLGSSAAITGFLEGLLGKRGTDVHVMTRINSLGEGDKHTRQFAAGYYGMLLAGGFALLAQKRDPPLSDPNAGATLRREEEDWLRQAMSLHAEVMVPPLGPRVKVMVQVQWSTDMVPGVVEELDGATFHVRLDTGELQHNVPRDHLKAEHIEQGLTSRCWLRARTWFPAVFGAGMATAAPPETLQQCLADAVDCYLAHALRPLMELQQAAEWERYRQWVDSQRGSADAAQAASAYGYAHGYGAAQGYGAAHGYGGGHQGQDYHRQQGEDQPPPLSSLEDYLSLCAFVLSPAAVVGTSAPPPRREPLPVPRWRKQLTRRMLGAWEVLPPEARSDEDRAVSGRPGLVRYFVHSRGHGDRPGLLGLLVEQGPQGVPPDPTALAALASYLDVVRGLSQCTDEDDMQVAFCGMWDDQRRQSAQLSLANLVTNAAAAASGGSERSVFYSIVRAHHLDQTSHAQAQQPGVVVLPLPPSAERYLSSALALVGAFVDSARRPWERTWEPRFVVDSGGKELKSLFEAMMGMLLQQNATRALLGQVLSTLSCWITNHGWLMQVWEPLCQRYALPYGPPTTPLNGEFETGIAHELCQECRARRYPQTVGFLRCVLQILRTADWAAIQQGAAAQAGQLQHGGGMAGMQPGGGAPVQVHTPFSAAAAHVAWALRSVFCKLDEMTYVALWDKWHMAILCLRIIRASLATPQPIEPDGARSQGAVRARRAPECPADVVWELIYHGDLVHRILHLCFERCPRVARDGAVMNLVLAEGLETVHAVLAARRGAADPRYGAPDVQLGGRGARRGVAQLVAAWREGSFVVQLASDEWHQCAVEGRPENHVSTMCLRVMLALARAPCRVSHHFIQQRGRPEDSCREAEQGLISLARQAHEALAADGAAATPGALPPATLADNIDKHVLRPLESGTRVGHLRVQIEEHLARPLDQRGMGEQAAMVRERLSVFVNNRAEEMQELFAKIVARDDGGADISFVEDRRALICQLIIETVSHRYYNLAHILCGVPERYVIQRMQGIRAPEADVIRGTRGRRTALSEMAELLADQRWVAAHPAAANNYYAAVGALASDEYIGRAVLRYLRTVNAVQVSLRVLQQRLDDLPALRSQATPGAQLLLREIKTAAEVLRLAGLDLYHQAADGVPQGQLLRLLLTSQGGTPLILKAISSIDFDELPAPTQPLAALRAAGPRGAAALLLACGQGTALGGGAPFASAEAFAPDVIAAAEDPALAAEVRRAHASFQLFEYVEQYISEWAALTTTALSMVASDPGSEQSADRAMRTEVDSVIFQVLMAVVTRLAADLSRGREAHTAAGAQGLIRAFVDRKRVDADLLLSQTAVMLLDTLCRRARFGLGAQARSPVQLSGMLSVLLQALREAEADAEIRKNLYYLLVLLLVHNAEQRGPDAAQAREAYRAELTECREPLFRRILEDIGKEDCVPVWSALTQLVHWDDGSGRLTAPLRSSHQISDQVDHHDRKLMHMFQHDAQDEFVCNRAVGHFASFMNFLFVYAVTPDGGDALLHKHQLLRLLAQCNFLRECASQMGTACLLVQERCVEVVTPTLKVVSAVAQRGPGTASARLAEHHLTCFLTLNQPLMEHLLRPPFNVSKQQGVIDLRALQLLSLATQLLAQYAAASAASAAIAGGHASPQNLLQLPQHFHLRQVLSTFACRRVWEQQLADPAGSSPAAAGTGAGVRAQARDLVGGVVRHVLSLMTHVAGAAAAAPDLEVSLFEPAMRDPDSVTAESNLARGDMTCLLCILKDLAIDGKQVASAAAAETGAQQANCVMRFSRGHRSISHALQLLYFHMRTADAAKAAGYTAHVAPVMRFVQGYLADFRKAPMCVRTQGNTQEAQHIAALARLISEATDFAPS